MRLIIEVYILSVSHLQESPAVVRASAPSHWRDIPVQSEFADYQAEAKAETQLLSINTPPTQSSDYIHATNDMIQ